MELAQARSPDRIVFSCNPNFQHTTQGPTTRFLVANICSIVLATMNRSGNPLVCSLVSCLIPSSILAHINALCLVSVSIKLIRSNCWLRTVLEGVEELSLQPSGGNALDAGSQGRRTFPSVLELPIPWISLSPYYAPHNTDFRSCFFHRCGIEAILLEPRFAEISKLQRWIITTKAPLAFHGSVSRLCFTPLERTNAL